jgi:hypothetical protein
MSLSLKAHANVPRLCVAQIQNKAHIRSSMLFVVLTILMLGGATTGASEARAASRLKVMAWNVKGGPCGTDRRMSPIAQVIREHDPDVVALQEIHRD